MHLNEQHSANHGHQQREHEQTFVFLEDVPAEKTFEVAQENLDAVFGGLTDKLGNDLIGTYGRGECLRVLARCEYVASFLKQQFGDTALCHPQDPNYFFTPELTEQARKAMMDLTPAGNPTPVGLLRNYHEANEVESVSDGIDGYYQYPAWDRIVPEGEEYDKNQELNFYRKLLVHIMTTQYYVDELGGKINEYIRLANTHGWPLQTGVFAQLRQNNGKYAEIDLERLKVRMLLHDIGRWVTHHEVLHETLPDLIANYIGLKPPLISHEFDHDERYRKGGDERVDPENIYIEESMLHYVDFVAKRHDENNLNDDRLRSLDQLAEHAISRAANYNGKLKEYLTLLKKMAQEKGSELSSQEKVNHALKFLQEESSDEQAQFYRREILFLQKVLPFFGVGHGTGILGAVGTDLYQLQERVEQVWNAAIEDSTFLSYNRDPLPDAVDKALLGQQ